MMDTPIPPGASPTPESAGPPTPAAIASPSRVWTSALLGALAAGLISFAAGEVIHARYAHVTYNNLPKLDRSVYGQNAGPLAERMREVEYASDDAIYAYGFLGALLGVALGLAGAVASRNTRKAPIAALAGLALGALGGAGASALVLPPIFAPGILTGVRALAYDSTRVMIMHGSIWAAIGAASGLVLSLGLGEKALFPQGVVGGMLGGALASLLYNMVGGFLVPATAEAYRPVAMEPAPRAAAHVCVGLLVAAGATLLLTSFKVTRPAQQPQPPA
jgi:hypothetical protein